VTDEPVHFTPPVDERVILHVDMDAFFASVEQLDDERLRGLPVLVGGTSGRGVVAAASYEARKFGCRSAMPMAQAIRLCPEARLVKPNFGRYREVSNQVRAVFEQFTPVVEPLSLDEAFLDCGGSVRLHGDGPTMAQKIRREVKSATGLTCSVGVSYNKFLAKLASDLNKPDGMAVIEHGTLRQILDPLPVTRVWGVGPKFAARLARFGIHKIMDVSCRSRESFVLLAGAGTAWVHDLSMGLDDRDVEAEHQTKSVGHEETFETNISEIAALRSILHEQIEQVATRLRKYGLLARTVTLKLRDGEFRTITRQTTLDPASDLTADLWNAAESLLSTWAGTSFVPLRLMGVSCGNLSTTAQSSLFGQDERDRLRKLDAVVDQIREKFGKGKIGRKA